MSTKSYLLSLAMACCGCANASKSYVRLYSGEPLSRSQVALLVNYNDAGWKTSIDRIYRLDRADDAAIEELIATRSVQSDLAKEIDQLWKRPGADSAYRRLAYNTLLDRLWSWLPRPQWAVFPENATNRLHLGRQYMQFSNQVVEMMPGKYAVQVSSELTTYNGYYQSYPEIDPPKKYQGQSVLEVELLPGHLYAIVVNLRGETHTLLGRTTSMTTEMSMQDVTGVHGFEGEILN